MFLRYDIREGGWATVTLGPKEGDTVEAEASWFNDPLKDLAVAATSLCKGAGSAEVVFTDEPGEHFLRLKRIGDGLLSFEFIRHDDWNQPPEKGIRVSQGEVRVLDFKNIVLSELKRILKEDGEAGYHRKWAAKFPSNEFHNLESA